MIVDKAKMYTNSEHGFNSSANHIAEFLVDPELRMLNNLPALPYRESFMVASFDGDDPNLYVTDSYGTISQVLASAIGRESGTTTKSLETNFSIAKKGILGAIELALQSLCTVTKPDANYIDVGVITPNRPFEMVDKNIVQACLNQMTIIKIEK
ncbi:proteasome subunit alpha type-7-like [Adelges cooleyi]|uniref:proteasome subunit alpha type-7-like n=1 Tax=Adelges cooleyi TaxID=133065 RepID=UPI00217F415E|nr:proteasome subunit alpha type-7-like [Adelges cooleyi]